MNRIGNARTGMNQNYHNGRYNHMQYVHKQVRHSIAYDKMSHKWSIVDGMCLSFSLGGGGFLKLYS